MNNEKEIDLTKIALYKSSLIQEIATGCFGFLLKVDAENSQYENRYGLDTNDVVLFCEDRQNDLINGIVHEITEMTIKKLLKENNVTKQIIESRIDSGSISFKIHHLITVLSLEYYGVQSQYIEEYESKLRLR